MGRPILRVCVCVCGGGAFHAQSRLILRQVSGDTPSEIKSYWHGEKSKKSKRTLNRIFNTHSYKVKQKNHSWDRTSAIKQYTALKPWVNAVFTITKSRCHLVRIKTTSLKTMVFSTERGFHQMLKCNTEISWVAATPDTVNCRCLPVWWAWQWVSGCEDRAIFLLLAAQFCWVPIITINIVM